MFKLALKGDERVLDIGCSDGKVTADIARKLPGGSVLGIDNSEEMICFTQKNFSTETHSNLAFQLMDAGNMNSDGRVLLQMAGKKNATQIVEI
ncbi:MAG: class I SAM-dependent methyltransferase [Candidatus Methanoperedens sp.]|nr:class I SAM-dependent methyltransferase [Candidatus Methanoperedens sp.]